MKLSFDTQLVNNYTSNPQKIRVLSEAWVGNTIFCPNCGHVDLEQYRHNKPVGDFYCKNCHEDYELKSKKSAFGNKIVDGAYGTMIKRLTSSRNPNFFLLNYDIVSYAVVNFLIIPKHFFVPEIIEKRKPLSSTAERHDWIGCNILLKHIPQIGKIFFVRDGQVVSREKVLSNWKKTLFLRDEKEIGAKGWLLDTMLCVEKIDRKEFSLDEIYAFENDLSKKHPDNRHIKDKIRQQLQVLRDNGYLEFTSRGNYQLTQNYGN
ncbi:MAG: DpnI domain-containing protein [bacterium]